MPLSSSTLRLKFNIKTVHSKKRSNQINHWSTLMWKQERAITKNSITGPRLFPGIQLPIIWTDKWVLMSPLQPFDLVDFQVWAYNRDQTDYFRNTLACASWAKMRSPRARKCCWRSRLDPKSNPLFKLPVLQYLSPKRCLTTVWETLEISCWALASGGLEGVDMLKTVALESETGPQIPPQCGQVVLACAQTTMRGVANIWAAAQHNLFP